MQPYYTTQERIYTLDGSKVYTQKLHENPHEIISLDSDFKDGLIAVNADSSLVAVASSKQVEVWLLSPKQDNARRIWKSNDFVIDSSIISMKWHPCARENSGLVLLTASHLVSVYLPLGQQPVIEKIQLKDSSNLSIEPVGFGFGADDAPLGQLSLYIGTCDGDIYKLSPFCPPEIQLKSEHLEVIKEYGILEGWKHYADQWSDETHSVVTVFKRPTPSLPKSFKDLEPLKLTPYPSEFYNETVLDLNSGSIGWAADIVVQSSDNYLNIYGAISPSSETLVLLSSIKFMVPQTQRKIIHISPNWVFVTTGSSIHVLNISSWTATHNEIDGDWKNTTTVEICQNDYILQTAREYVSLHGNKIWPKKHISLTMPSEKISPTIEWSTDDVETAGDISSYLLSASPRLDTEADKLVETLTPPPFVANWGANLGSLARLEEESEKYHQRIAVLAKKIAYLDLERQAQVREVLSQSTEGPRLHKSISDTTSRLQALSQKVAAANKRQSELQKRLANVAADVKKAEESKQSHPPGKAEEEWFVELKHTLPRKLEALDAQANNLSKSLTYLKTEDALSLASDSESKHIATPMQTTELHWRLKNQDSVINSLISKLK